MSLPKNVNKLVEQFRENHNVYCSSAYDEAQARHEFIDPRVNRKSLIQRQTDQLAYKLYGLTIKEIRIVEETVIVSGKTVRRSLAKVALTGLEKVGQDEGRYPTR